MDSPPDKQWLLRYFPWRWALYWLLVPNLVMVLMWPMGGPPMVLPLFAAGILGLVLSQIPWVWARRLSAVTLTLGMTVLYVARNFNIDPTQLSFAPVYFREASPMQSPIFLAGLAITVVAVLIGWTAVPRVPRFTNAMNWVFGALVVVAAMHFDNFATAATRGAYDAGSTAQAFQSAVAQTGREHPGPARHNLVLIMVEALGVPTSPAGSALFAADWDRPAWRARYKVKTGAVPYFGSTLGGEMRELCGVWSRNQLDDLSHADCLPARYLRAGYETTAVHAFAGSMFDRSAWWSEAGFQHRLFRSELYAAGARLCGGVFPGVCDTDVPQQITARLERATRPQLVYWLTLNSHLPVIEEASLGTANCAYGGAALRAESDMLCPLFQVHHRLADAITRMALDPRLPPTDFLIVGDHMPPFFQRDARSRFDGNHVPFILLEWNGGAARPAALEKHKPVA